MKVKDILAMKGTEVITIGEDKSVYEAMETFAKHKVGSLLVIDNKGGIIGIIAARDVLMDVLEKCDKIKETKVQKIMTRKLIIGNPEDDIDYVQAVMTENRIRHLPIIENQKLAGLVSIGDVVKAQLKKYDVENKYLKDFIVGKYPA